MKDSRTEPELARPSILRSSVPLRETNLPKVAPPRSTSVQSPFHCFTLFTSRHLSLRERIFPFIYHVFNFCLPLLESKLPIRLNQLVEQCLASTGVQCISDEPMKKLLCFLRHQRVETGRLLGPLQPCPRV